MDGTWSSSKVYYSQNRCWNFIIKFAHVETWIEDTRFTLGNYKTWRILRCRKSRICSDPDCIKFAIPGFAWSKRTYDRNVVSRNGLYFWYNRILLVTGLKGKGHGGVTDKTGKLLSGWINWKGFRAPVYPRIYMFYIPKGIAKNI